MRLIYLGSPQDSIYPLEYIKENKNSHKHEIIAVVSHGAKISGRGRHEEMDPPLIKYAKEAGIPTLQPQSASDADFQETLRDLKPDLMITCAFGQILNQSFLDIPKRGTINIHPSLLPRYRGATPVQAALLDGLKETGITILFTVKEMDAGNIILQHKELIQPKENSGELMTRLFKLSGPMLLQAVDKLEDPHFTGIPQDTTQITKCKKIKKEDGLIDWNATKSSIINKFRAYNPWPASFTFLKQKRIILSVMEATENSVQSNEVGSFTLKKEENALYVRCADGCVKVLSLKPEGSRQLSATEFWNGIKNREHLKFTSVMTE